MGKAVRGWKTGFTLIELLIVVAIIGILAAIAIPNFLEAQVRAKVSRVKSDLRGLATAMESYHVDHTTYTMDQDNNPGHTTQRGFYRLTTPIEYITDFFTFHDPFQKLTYTPHPASDPAPFYEMGSGADNGASFRVQCFEISSVGPDQQDVYPFGITGNDEFPFACAIATYDPTNGTVSSGDIVRFGGDYRQGTYSINGFPHQQVFYGDSMP